MKLMIDQNLIEQLLNDYSLDRKQYIGEWPIEQRELILHKLAAKYHDECERYDRSVCTGVCPYTNTAAPVGPYERQLIDMNAIAVRERIYAEALKEGYSKQEVRIAISNFRF